MMRNDNRVPVTNIGPDLCTPPHVLPLLMDLFFGQMQQAYIPKEQLLAHLTVCHYCRTTLDTLLSIVRDYDQKIDASDGVSQELLERFIQIGHEIEVSEAHQYERLGAYAETSVALGQRKAELRFPDVATHLKSCPDCRSTIASTVAFIIELEDSHQVEEDIFHDGS